METTGNSELLLLHCDKPKLLCFGGKVIKWTVISFDLKTKQNKQQQKTHRELQMTCRTVEHLSCFTLERELALCHERPLESYVLE